MSYDINSQQVDIENLFKQNELDLCSIKELYTKLKDLEKKISQIKYIDSKLADKLKKDYEKLKRVILDENIQVSLSNDIKEIDMSINNINNDIKEIDMSINNINNDVKEIDTSINNANNDINEINTRLDTKASEADLVVERNRINNLAKLGEGSTTGDAELIDSRVGADGVTYPSTGDAIRSQMKVKANNIQSYVEVPLSMIGGLMNQKNGNIVTISNYSHFEIDVNSNEKYKYNGYHISSDFAVIIFKNSSDEMVGDYLPNPIISSGKLVDFEFNVPNGATKMYINTNNTTSAKLEKMIYSELDKEVVKVKDRVKKNETEIEILKNNPSATPPYFYNSITSDLENYVWTINNVAYENNAEWYKHKKYRIGEYVNVKVRCQGMNNICPGVLCFSSTGELLYSYSENTNKIENFEFTTPKGTTLVVLNGTNSYRPSLSTKEIYNGNGISHNPLYGKKISCNGDSIMYGLGYEGGFLKIIADKYNMTLNNIAISGGTLSNPNNNEVHYIGGTIENMDSDSDYYIVEGGYNDWLYNTNLLGEITPTMTSEINDRTVYGGMETICRKLLKNFPGKKIGFVITHKILQSAFTDKGKGFTMTDVHDAIIKVLKKYSIPYCDLFNNSCLNTELEEYLKYTNANDGVHPDELGYVLFYVSKVEAWLKTL